MEHLDFNTECPVFEINYNGTKRRICNQRFTDETVFQTGQEYTLYVNPNDLNDFVIKGNSDFKAFAFFMYLMCLFGFVLLLKGVNIDGSIIAIFSLTYISFFFSYIFLVNLIEYCDKTKKCTQSIDATIAGFKTHIDHDSDSGITVRYKTVYEIFYNNKKYRIANQVYAMGVPKIGAVVNIKINPNQPRMFIDKTWCFYTFIAMIVSVVSLSGILYSIITIIV